MKPRYTFEPKTGAKSLYTESARPSQYGNIWKTYDPSWGHFAVEPHRAVVIFKSDTEIWWLRWLRPGFRHCLVALEDAWGWSLLDPLSNQSRLMRLDYPQGFDLASFLRRNGVCAIETVIEQAPPRLAPWLFFTCTEAVKRLLGIQSWRIWTPYQLFLFLGKKTLKNEKRTIIFTAKLDHEPAKNRKYWVYWTKLCTRLSLRPVCLRRKLKNIS